MGQVIPITAAQPRRARPQADDLAVRIESIREEAERRGFSALGYFLDIAVTEALVQARRAADADPDAAQEAPPVPSTSNRAEGLGGREPA